MNKETSQKAAKWWADQLRGGAKLDNGDKSETGAMTFMLAAMLQVQETALLDSIKIQKFEDCLSEILQETEARSYFSFGVDYHPDGILCDAAEKAGVSLGMTTLPWKTTMWINGDKVSVRCGYGAETVNL